MRWKDICYFYQNLGGEQMKLKVFLAALTLCAANTAFAADVDLGLKDSVDPKAKEAIEAAYEMNKKAQDAGAEWIWAFAQEGIWEQTSELMSSTSVLIQAIEMANEGKTDAAIQAANYIKESAESGLKQAELAPKAGPADYGL
jgi:hypothetical protein